MKSPLSSNREWVALDEVDSTQDIAAKFVREGREVGVVFALDQRVGRGRLGRTWVSAPGSSLTCSLIFWDYPSHPKAYLVGMALSLAAAGAIHAQLRWPNDLVVGERKVAGILTEMIVDPAGRSIPVVGLGINLNQQEFPPEIESVATSLALAHGGSYDAETVCKAILNRLATLPEPNEWSDLAPIWSIFDKTPGKRYRLASGKEAVGLGIGSEGQLLCSVEGESHIVLAAEAIFGHP